MAVEQETLGQLVQAVLGSAKYRHMHQGLVERIGAAELGKGRKIREAVKATKNKLHQVGGAYFAGELAYETWLVELSKASGAGEQDRYQKLCREAMQQHASTRERLPILESFFTTTLREIAPLRSVLDVACGLNPLAIPWMPLADQAQYYACDIYADLALFLQSYLDLLPTEGQVWLCDAVSAPPEVDVELALVLKTLPCLEQIDKSAGARLLESLNARRLLVTFPVSSLGGREKGMAANYGERFEALLNEKGWQAQRFEFETELAYLIKK